MNASDFVAHPMHPRTPNPHDEPLPIVDDFAARAISRSHVDEPIHTPLKLRTVACWTSFRRWCSALARQMSLYNPSDGRSLSNNVRIPFVPSNLPVARMGWFAAMSSIRVSDIERETCADRSFSASCRWWPRLPTCHCWIRPPGC